MQRYFAKFSLEENCFFLAGDDYHHITKVMRMKENDHIICVSDDQKSAQCSIEKITTENVIARIIKWIEESPELPVTVSIASGLPKGDKLEWIIQKGTELGAAEFIPFIADRSIVKWDRKKGDKKVSRWEKIAKEAAEQSHRNMIPKVSTPISFLELLQSGNNYDIKLICYEEMAREGETKILASSLSKIENGNSLLVVFGPEGGLSSQEVNKLKEVGFVPCSLGPRILRTETAPLYLLSAVSYHLELLR